MRIYLTEHKHFAPLRLDSARLDLETNKPWVAYFPGLN